MNECVLVLDLLKKGLDGLVKSYQLKNKYIYEIKC